MKKIFFALFTGLIAFSCNSSKKMTDTRNDQSQQIWENGITTISGIITSVKTEKEGQIISLKGKDGTDYNCLVSITELGDNREQYRSFSVGEHITFSGNLSADNHIKVRQILENR